MNCQYCGNPIPSNTASCPACGARCEVQPEPAATAAPAAAPSDGPVDLYIVGLLDQSKKVEAIKLISGIGGLSLMDAKKAVEGNLTPIKFGISATEAAVLQTTLAVAGISATTQPANPALKAANPTTVPSPQKSGCLIMFAPLAAAVIWLLILK